MDTYLNSIVKHTFSILLRLVYQNTIAHKIGFGQHLPTLRQAHSQSERLVRPQRKFQNYEPAIPVQVYKPVWPTRLGPKPTHPCGIPVWAHTATLTPLHGRVLRMAMLLSNIRLCLTHSQSHGQAHVRVASTECFFGFLRSLIFSCQECTLDSFRCENNPEPLETSNAHYLLECNSPPHNLHQPIEEPRNHSSDD